MNTTFNNVKIAFEVFRFENNRAVEHWDNIQVVAGPNKAGRSMTDGSTETTDLDLTEQNRSLVQDFTDTVLTGKQFDRLPDYVSPNLVQHDPEMSDGLAALRAVLEASDDISPIRSYDTVHRVLAEGNFVLCMCEGTKNNNHSGIYDLYRLANGKIVEHWSTVEKIPPRSDWKNDNGKF